MIRLPKPIEKKVVLPDGRSIRVVRDDLLPGGTKVRALVTMLKRGGRYAYAGPAEGYAQIALARAAQIVGAEAFVFIAKRRVLHQNTKAAWEFDAEIHEVEHGYLTVVQSRAKAFCALHNVEMLPFGIDCVEAEVAIAQAASSLDPPGEVWCVAGSGTLSRALVRAWPRARINAVRIGKEPNVGKARLYAAPEKFAQDAKVKPPFPSCSNYDAKMWQFVLDYAADGAMVWNVGA